MLDDKLDSIMHENFTENVHDPTETLSVDDRFVINKYESSVKNVGCRYKISLPFKKDHILLILFDIAIHRRSEMPNSGYR